MPNRKRKIYFVHNCMMSFVEKDLFLLNSVFGVKIVDNWYPIRNIVRNIADVINSDVIFCWFCSIKFAVPILVGKLLRKKIVVVAGGYDVVRMPEIQYGGMLDGWATKIRRLLYRLSDCVICISKSNRREAIKNARIIPEKIQLIYHGFTAPQLACTKKEKIVLTIGKVDQENLERKGLRYFIETSKFFPEIPFYLVGKIEDELKFKIEKECLPNLKITGYLDSENLKDILNRSKVYVQASRHEGFGCSVAEAMLHECIPVVSNCYALPEVVGETGFLVTPGDIQSLRQHINIALNSSSELGKKARRRILKEFPLESRQKALTELLRRL